MEYFRNIPSILRCYVGECLPIHHDIWVECHFTTDRPKPCPYYHTAHAANVYTSLT